MFHNEMKDLGPNLQLVMRLQHMLLSLPELLLQLNLKQAVKQVILMPNMNRARIQFALMSDHGSRASKTSRGTHKADREREDRKMLEMLGSLEYGYLRPKPIFPTSTSRSPLHEEVWYES